MFRFSKNFLFSIAGARELTDIPSHTPSPLFYPYPLFLERLSERRLYPVVRVSLQDTRHISERYWLRGGNLFLASFALRRNRRCI